MILAMVWVLGIALLVMVAIAMWLNRNARLLAVQQPAVRTLEYGTGCGYACTIPPIIWTYWHDACLPLVVERCIKGWQRLNPDYTVHVLHTGNLGDYLDDIPIALEQLNVAKQTDWIRLALLHRYGGIWMDASIVLTQPLDWLTQLQNDQKADFVGFYLDGYTNSSRYPVVESWLLAAVPQSAFIAQWLFLFRQEVVDGQTETYLTKLRTQGVYRALVQKIGDPSYHTIHVAAQDVLQRPAKGTYTWRLMLLRAEDTAYWLQLQSRWKRRRLFARLLWARGSTDSWPPLVKLRGGERSKLEFWLRLGLHRRGSLVERYLGDPS